MSCRVWLEVEDLFEYATHNPRLTGIQRVQFELFRALVALDRSGMRIGFVKHDPKDGSFRIVPWASVEAVGRRLRDAEAGPVGSRREQLGPARPGFLRRQIKQAIHRLPPRLRQPLVGFLLDQRTALASLGRLVRAAASRGPLGGLPTSDWQDAGAFDTVARSGDVFLATGAIWSHPDYASLVRANCTAKGIRFAMLVHDIIPIRRPEWCDPPHVRAFRAWFDKVLGAADFVLSISRATADDIERYAAEQGRTVPARVRVVPLGSGFEKNGASASTTARPLPASGSYALIVSTIEVRKNHLLLFRIWRLLLDDLPAEQVPKLVFAGRIGWMVADLMQQLRNCDFLGGKIVLLEEPSDAELERLYEGCLFTLFPSFYEGWGLPVTESLAFGRPCIVSNTTSLPEAGGKLARYFDPYSTRDAYAVIRDVLSDPPALAAWQEQVATAFRPVSWHETATVLLDAVEAA